MISARLVRYRAKRRGWEISHLVDEIGDSSIGGRIKFPNYPPQAIVEDFRQHVIATGTPDTWAHHTPSKPPADGDFHEIIRFSIPESKRAEVGKASCPICSPMAPKYFEGSLAWFEDEQALRAIGHECAKNHFGEDAVARSKILGRKNRAEDYLLRTLPIAGAFRDRAKTLIPAADAMDRLREAVHRWTSKSACERVAKLGARGSLPIEETVGVETVNSFGQSETRRQSRVVGSVDVAGLGFLADRRSSLVAAQYAVDATAPIQTLDAEQALELVLSIGSDMDNLLAAERLLRAGLAAVDEMADKVVEARAFCAAVNLQRLADWTHDERVDVGIVISFTAKVRDQIKVRTPSKAWQTLTIPAPLL